MKIHTNIHLENAPRLGFDVTANVNWIDIYNGNTLAGVSIFIASKHAAAVRRAVEAFNAALIAAEEEINAQAAE